MFFELNLTHQIGGRTLELNARSAALLTGLVGPSGIGKTSILHCLAGLSRPANGRISIGGKLLFDSSSGIDLPPEQRRAGVIFQDNRLFPHLRVQQNLTYGMKLTAPDERWITLQEMCSFLAIEHLLDRYPSTLSGGEARRVAIGRALLAAPHFLLMDEPLTSLDPARAEEILRLIERIRDELRLPILYVSHNPEEIDRLSGYVIRME
ncbi:ATP-binding cassette domain-containing protein [Altericroceibacterium endophyticum]|uniref:ATP-binding cassette domain-containing protein n=1 Tax=Altericroceibacterium endophyticum TaxID=1808508 RepID=A0A6I4T8P8_9SPHN|nr:ATP-binding cassette domain-containing protein [Altericroceibacterium endophyticum]MXO66642.1 ATP-binding cassette domain-containing protein [Altericroceibacterium endophyticum]